jgi:uncharacterized protein YbjQ (UPF0145 family)
MIVTTMNDIPGYAVDEVYGEVMGLTVRSRNIGSQIGAGFKSILGGELKGMTKALVESRRDVMDRMVAEAEEKGANAIIAMRFDTSDMGSNWTEICAYGTAAPSGLEEANSAWETTLALVRGSSSQRAKRRFASCSSDASCNATR